MKTLTLNAKDIGKGSLILVNPSHPVRNAPGKETLVPAHPGYRDVLLEQDGFAAGISKSSMFRQRIPGLPQLQYQIRPLIRCPAIMRMASLSPCGGTSYEAKGKKCRY